MFEFSPFHIAMVLLGAGLILAYWLPRFVSGREPAASALLILAGALVGLLVPALPAMLDPRLSPDLWEHAAELALIVALFGTGLRIDSIAGIRRWTPTIRLLAIAMPLSILAMGLLGTAAGMTLAGAILLGAVLAPTDPVLASDVQVGPPQEGGEHPVRFALTTEAGLNDGLAFPFVHLALAVGAAGVVGADLLAGWLLIDVGYRVAVGAAAGMWLGWLLARILFDLPRENPLARTSSGVVALAGVLVTYGATELVEGYGFIAAFVAGLVLRRSEARHEFHRTLHSFTDTLEHALTAALLLALGIMMPALLETLSLAYAALGLALVFVVRPVIAWASLLGTDLSRHGRLVTAFYGVRGIGSLYYIAYAGAHLELANEADLWAAVGFTIALSTVVHGVTAGLAIEAVEAAEPELCETEPPKA